MICSYNPDCGAERDPTQLGREDFSPLVRHDREEENLPAE
jgi:hypothetical protein